MDKLISSPRVMPIDREKWFKDLNISNFINSYYQYRDLQTIGNINSILIVGPGQGLDTEVFKWRGYKVTTFDIDETFSPDVLGSVHDMNEFSDKEFDVVIASHVLEHLHVDLLNNALSELARIAFYSIVYLPVNGTFLQVKVNSNFKIKTRNILFGFSKYFFGKFGLEPKFMGGQHYWEVGLPGFRVKELEKRISQNFNVLFSYRNPDWPQSYNFVLKSKT